jgi:leader peptidase (prepilin peptidase)/N-methyltransferase
MPPETVDPAIFALLFTPGARMLAFVWGLLWGSFCNVVIWRLPRGENLAHPPSHCPQCGTRIAWYDNVPIFSYLLLRGKCRHCGAKFSMRYLIVELIGGLLAFATYMQYVLVPLAMGQGLEVLWTWLFVFVLAMALVCIAYIDLDLWIIPDEIVLPLGGISLLLAWLQPQMLGVGIRDAAIAAAAGLLLVVVLRFVYQRLRGIEALGLGDGKLLLMVGAAFGPAGLVWTVGAGAVQGLLVSVPMLAFGKELANTKLEDVHGDDPELGEEDPDAGVMGRRVPFGPFLALAALEWLLLRSQIQPLVQWLF